ncbi:unnamed protein product, partial [Laminaria digitata]
MGFSEARARQALTKHKELTAAVDWLTNDTGDGKEAGERPFVLCTEEEGRLLAGAGASLVSEASLAKASPSSPSEGASGQGDAGTGAPASTRAVGDEDDGRVLRALRSPSLQSTLNVTGMRDDLLPDLIGQTLPAEWRGSGGGGRGGGVSGVSPGVLSETAFTWTPGRAGHPDVDWFRSLWGYLALTRPSAVRLLAESFPVVPTGEAAVCPLSLSSAVIDASGLGGDVRSILVKAGCRTLLPGVFAGGIGDTAAAAAAVADSPVTPSAEGKEAGNAPEGTGEAFSVARRQLPPPPVELFEYVRSGTRRGVLAALGTAQRSAGKPLAVLMRVAGANERDALRCFLAREPASDLSDVEVAVCRGLPIVPLHEDGLKTALALAKAGPAAAAVAAAAKAKEAAAKAGVVKPNGGSRTPDRNASLPATPPGGGTYTHADEGPLYLLLERGMGLIGVGGRGSGDTTEGSTAPAAAPPPPLQWLETHLFTPRFVKGSGDSGAGSPGAAEAALLKRLGAELVGRATFFVDHVFPRIRELPAGLRDAAMVEALLAAPRLSQQHQRFKGELVKLEFIPVGGRVSTGLLVRPRDAFDPEVPELPALLPESRFPNATFRHPDVLAALRPLGLQSTLDWPGLVEAAASVESSHLERGKERGGGNGEKGGGKGEKEEAAVRGRALMTYLDTHEVRLFDLKKQTPGLFQKLAQRVFQDPEAGGREKERLAALHQLAVLSWVPVLASFPSPLVPSTSTAKDALSLTGAVVAPPHMARLREDMWVSSRTFYVLDAEVRSSAVRAAFSWDVPLDPAVVARQVTALAETFSELREKLLPTESSSTAPPATAADGDSKGGDGTSSSPQQNARTLEGHRQTMAGVVPKLYQLLSNAVDADDARRSGVDGNTGPGRETESIRAVLHEAPWLWVGDGFVPADQARLSFFWTFVAFMSPANAAPYLYAVPPDLACFATLLRRFGVRSSFGPSDFCHALRRLAVETGAADPAVSPASAVAADNNLTGSQVTKGGGGTVKSLVALAGYGKGEMEGEGAGGGGGGGAGRVRVARELSPAQVELAVAMVQVLSDESIRVSDLEVWVPDASGVLALSTNLLYDDAPWLTNKNLSSLEFDLGLPGESFGQQESLTRRLKHILQMYPEGPSELVQNADDAGARTVRVMLNTREYGDGSLLSPAMSNWQGPSLYVYNDAVFTDRDFENLAKIGQASKLDKLVATGRFGLGFNSVYHFTDLPSLVSGEHLVMFDPHTKYVPGATSVQPGIKIRFADTNLLEQFPDQFSPYLFFGCELKNRFDGTLFRFPLRTAAAARASEISHASYSAESVMDLLNQFKEAANRCLLFLRHVQRIEMYTLGDNDTSPVLQYSVEVTKRDPPGGWLTVPTFVSGPPRRPLSKEAFYAKLGQTPDSALPKVEQMVTITLRQEAKRASGNGSRGSGVEVQALAIAEGSDSESEIVDVGVGDGSGDGGGGGGGGGAGSESGGVVAVRPEKEKAGKGATSTVDVFLVCAAIGGGEAKKMACLPQHRRMKLIPWGGVAAHISRNSQPPPTFVGHAFCFLPLPVNTLLPVHVNGFFELSSNRQVAVAAPIIVRDIWFGEDMAGEGKRRSEWNTLLLRDVIAPIYASLVLRARDVMNAGPQHRALLPAAETPKPWETVVAATYANLKNVPVLYSRSGAGEMGRWITPGQAVVVDEEEEDGGGGGEERVEYAKRLTKILLWDRLPVVRLPASLKKTMLHYNCLGADATPSFLRSHFRSIDIPHPCLALEAGGGKSSTTTLTSTSSTRGAQGRAGRGHVKPPSSYAAAAAAPGTPGDSVRSRPPAIRSDARSNALFLLKAATAGLGGDTFGELVGLPLLPLADGSLGRFLAPPVAAAGMGDEAGDEAPTKDTIFVCSRAERRLLAGAGLGGEGGGAGNRLLEDLEGLDQAAKVLLSNRRVHEATNVAVMEPSDLAGVLGAVFPEAWKGLTQVAWAPGSRDVRPRQPSEEWVSSLWDYICTSGDSRSGSLASNGGRARREDQNNSDTERLQLFEGAWPLLPATGGVGSDEIRVLLQLHGEMPVVSPLTDGMGARMMGTQVKKVLSQLGVWILDAPALGGQAENPLILKYANPCNPSGVLRAMQQALFPSGPQPRPNGNGDPAAAAEVAALDFGPGGNARRRVDNRFQSVGSTGRDALRGFLCSFNRRGRVTDEQLDFLKALPIFRVHGAESREEEQWRRGGGAVGFTSISGAERLLLAPRNSDHALLGREFAMETDQNTELLQSLGLQRVGKGAFFREHVLP